MTKYIIKIEFDNPMSAVWHVSEFLKRAILQDIKNIGLEHEDEVR